MFKEKKVEKFIEKYAAEFANHNYTELAEFLCKFEDVKKTISRINKLSEEDKYYVLSTIIEYKKYNYNEETVNLILNHKLDLINKFGSSKECPNLDHIYYALQPNRNLYIKLITGFMENRDLESDDNILVNYSEVLTVYCKEFNNMFDTNCSSIYLKRQLLHLEPEQLKMLLAYDSKYSTKENKKRLFRYLVKNSDLKEDIQALNPGNFYDLLKFVFSNPNREDEEKEDFIYSRIKFIPELVSHMDYSKEYKLDRDFIDHLSQIPTSFLEELSNKESETRLENYKFVDVINEYKNQDIVDMAIKRLETFKSKKSASMFIKFITDDFFIRADVNKQKVLLELFPIDKISTIDEKIEMVIPDYNSLNNSFEEQSEMEFINPKTKQKIIIRSKNKQND